MESGLVISLRFGQGCTIENLRIKPIEPVAGFKVFGKNEDLEFYLPVFSQNQSIPFDDDFNWLVFRHTFTARNCTLALVENEWFFQSAVTEDFPPGIRMEFTEKNKRLEWKNTNCEWMGNGIEIQIGDEIHTMIEGDTTEFVVDGLTVQMQLDALKGRSGAKLRVHKPYGMKLDRDI